MKVWVLAVLGCVCAYFAVAQMRGGAPDGPAFPNQTQAPAVATSIGLNLTEFAGPLDRPWGIARFPELGYVVTERGGTLRLVTFDGALSDPIGGLPDIYSSGQGGLLDVAVSPAFSEDRMIYFTYAKPVSDGMSVTAAARGVLAEDGSALIGVADIFVQDPPSPTGKHYGSRIVFDGAGHLFITTGDHSTRAERVLAQDIETTYGKIIRVYPDGSVPESNPYVGRDGVDTVWSFGHRNVQGAVVHPQTGQLWTLEHGPRGGDELNAPLAGLNYGWPLISYGVNYNGTPVGDGAAQMEGMEQPRYYWTPVIAPSDLIVYQGDAFPEWKGDFLIGSLSPGGVVRLVVEGDMVVGEERLFPDIGRVRDIQETPEGHLLLLMDVEGGSILRVSPQE